MQELSHGAAGHLLVMVREVRCAELLPGCLGHKTHVWGFEKAEMRLWHAPQTPRILLYFAPVINVEAHWVQDGAREPDKTTQVETDVSSLKIV